MCRLPARLLSLPSLGPEWGALGRQPAPTAPYGTFWELEGTSQNVGLRPLGPKNVGLLAGSHGSLDVNASFNTTLSMIGQDLTLFTCYFRES